MNYLPQLLPARKYKANYFSANIVSTALAQGLKEGDFTI